jgi:hypothetical protein
MSCGVETSVAESKFKVSLETQDKLLAVSQKSKTNHLL